MIRQITNSTKSKIRLAELLGIILGDGNLNKKSNCVTIVGGLEDYYYYEYWVIPLIKSLFNVNLSLRKRNDSNALYITFCSKGVMDYLSKNIGLVRGNKVDANVPFMINHNPRLIFPFLRGLFDTDGCLKFSKQTKSKNYYPRIQFCFRDTRFAEQVKELLRIKNFKLCSWKETRLNGLLVYYQISGKNNLEKWMKTISPNNLVHKTKYLFWKRYGFYIPKSSLRNRIEALNLNIDY